MECVFLLKSLIRDAHRSFSPLDEGSFKVRTHDIRVIATSLAFSRNVSLNKILEATNWRTRNIFTSVYLKDITFSFKKIFSMGPMVAAQSVISCGARGLFSTERVPCFLSHFIYLLHLPLSIFNTLLMFFNYSHLYCIVKEKGVGPKAYPSLKQGAEE